MPRGSKWASWKSHMARDCGWLPADGQQEARALSHSRKPGLSPWVLHHCVERQRRIKLKPLAGKAMPRTDPHAPPVSHLSLLSFLLSALPLRPSAPCSRESLGNRWHACTSVTPKNKEARGEKLRNLIWLAEASSHSRDLHAWELKFAYHYVFKINLCTFLFDSGLKLFTEVEPPRFSPRK